MKQSVRPLAAALGLLPLALLLTGCFGGPSLPNLPGGGGDPNTDELVEDIVEGTGDGIDFESGALPEDFPVDDIPLVDGEVTQSITVTPGEAWMVYIDVPDQATAESATALLEAAGFTDDAMIAWENGEYVVVVVPQEGDGGWTVYYQVQVAQ